MRLTRAEQQQRTREEILAAADRLFVEQGFHATSVDQIAQAARYTKGAVYSNFDAKEDLFFAIYEQRMERALAEVERRKRQTGDPRSVILAMTSDTARRRGRDDRWLATFFEFWAHVVRRPALRARFAAIHARMRDSFAEGLQQMAAERDAELPVGAQPAAAAMLAMSFGLALERLVQPDVVDDQLGVRVTELVLDDLVKGASDGGTDRTAAGGGPRAAARARAGRT
jgi:AcrR family transcriptional regulator